MNRSRKLWLLLFGAAAVLAVVSLVDNRAGARLRTLEAETASYEAKNRVLRQGNATMTREIQALRPDGDPRALEQAAREDLGLVKPNELIFNFVPSGKSE